MGCFDTVWLTCPHCNASVEEQTKAGPCSLADYRLDQDDAPMSVRLAMVGPHRCESESCGKLFLVELVQLPVFRTRAPLPGEALRYD